MKTSLRHFAAEFVGTFALVFIGGGAIMMAQMTNSTAGLVTIALAHGLILALMVSATMNVSGGQLNPALTLGLLSARRITASMAGVHILAQLAGAVIAAMALKATISAAKIEISRRRPWSKRSPLPQKVRRYQSG